MGGRNASEPGLRREELDDAKQRGVADRQGGNGGGRFGTVPPYCPDRSASLSGDNYPLKVS